MVHCYVCGKDIGYMGWPNHVRMEKRKYGNDIFKRKLLERQNILGLEEQVERLDSELKNKRLSDFEDVE